MSKKYKIGLVVIIVLIFFFLSLGILKLFWCEETEEKPKNTTIIISDISEYGYSLEDRDTQYMKEVFKELENILINEKIDYEMYAQKLAELFIIDFYTLTNKINKYDVGSLEYVMKDKVEMFKTKAIDTIYSDIIDNTYKNRVQKLPEVNNVKVIDTELTKIKLNDIEEDCYKVTLKYTYRKDLGYDTLGEVYLIKNLNKLEVALYKPIMENEID